MTTWVKNADIDVSNIDDISLYSLMFRLKSAKAMAGKTNVIIE